MADTIKTGTILIEEGTLLPESLQCESDPWTSFYTACGIIRELRKASGKQSKYGSPNGRDNQYGNYPYQGWRILTGRAEIRK